MIVEQAPPWLWIVVGRRRPVANHAFPAAIEPERAPGQVAFLLASKQHGPSVAQHAVLCPWPIEPFFQMLQRVSPLEPGVQHSMRKHVIRSAGVPQSPPGAEAV